ncbi:MAG: hypothetical protein ACI8PV_001230 [Dinoroseobacter sp.]|jgi:hypothetical protein
MKLEPLRTNTQKRVELSLYFIFASLASRLFVVSNIAFN